MKKSLNFVLGLLFVGFVGSANAENGTYQFYPIEKFQEVNYEICWDLLMKKTPSKEMFAYDKNEEMIYVWLTRYGFYNFEMKNTSEGDNILVNLSCRKLTRLKSE